MVWIMNLLSMEIWQLITIHTLKEKIVTSVGIAPNNISEEEFISHYNNYDKRNFRDIVYNNIKGNGYEIVVYLDGDKVGLIFAVPEY